MAHYRFNEFRDVPWSRGWLLDTRTMRRWSEEQRQECHKVEICEVFAHFRYSDEGRSREFLGRFNTPQEASLCVQKHNTRLAWKIARGEK